MINRFKTAFRNLAFQKKIMAISLISGIFPLLLLVFFSVGNIYQLMSTTEQSNTQDNLNSVEQQLQLRLTTLEEGISYLANNELLTTALAIENPSNFAQYDLYTNTIVPLFRGVASQQSAIEAVTLYTTINLYDHSTYVKKIVANDITQHFTLNNTTENDYYFDPETQKLYLYTQIYSAKKTDINIIVFEVSLPILFAGFDTISLEPYQLSISDATHQSLFTFSNETENQQLNFFAKIIQFFNNSYSTSMTELTNQWEIAFSRPNYSVYYGVFLQAVIAILIFILAVIMLTLSIFALSRTIVSPIKNLAQDMENAPEKTLESQFSYESKDEIGRLYESFSDMIVKINQLIDDVYKGEIQQQKHELRALQAQINPHFFYNSLSLINNKAIVSDNLEISEMAQLLSNFYRLSLNNGESKLTVAKELELTIIYAKIQLKMHNYSFDLVTEVADSLMDYQIITLLIQPFVENAIFHGIDHIADQRRGKLSILGYETEQQLIFEISDNGAGMTDEQLKHIFTFRSKHYGMRNVQQRIKLYYGLEDAIEYFSEVNVGTTVKISLPKGI
ncbi:sensor histidine kinase [Enterococcus sp. LJL90]